MSKHPRSCHPTGDPHPLERLLLHLGGSRDPQQDHPELLIVHGRSTSAADAHRDRGEPSAIEIRPLRSEDPVAELIGIEAADTWQVIGVRAPAMAHRVVDPDTDRRSPLGMAMRDTQRSCSFVHLIDRRGTSITELSIPGAESIRLGPDRTVRDGRIADACRRVFALPTAPPPEMTAFVIDAWLTLALRAALRSPGLEWADVVALSCVEHLGVHGARTLPGNPPSPAELARALRAISTSLDWGRYRDACIALGGCPVSELTGAEIAWMDTGMFARWAHGALPGTAELLDLLEPTLDPVAHDRLWATVSLTERGPSDPRPL